MTSFLRLFLRVLRPYRSLGLAAMLLALMWTFANSVAADDEATSADPPGVAELQRGEVALKQMRFKAARQDLQAARTQFRENKDAAHELEALMLLGQLETAVKNHRLATHYLAQARALLERTSGAQPNLAPAAPVEAEESPGGLASEHESETQVEAPNVEAATAPAAPPDAAIPLATVSTAPSARPMLARAQANPSAVTAAPAPVEQADAGVDTMLVDALPSPIENSQTQLPPATDVDTSLAPPTPNVPTPEPNRSPSFVEALLTALFVLAMGGLGMVVGLIRRKSRV